jgi:phosphoribosylformylglycinamidine (FGAM) synthase PurS component
MCRKLLANTVIENFRIERLEDAPRLSSVQA